MSVLEAEWKDLIASCAYGERLREGWKVVVAGNPNVGKSSLFNALVGRDAAIVSPVAGTTRDVIAAHLDFGGYPIALMDLAGIREAADLVEGLGIERALGEIDRADFVILARDRIDQERVDWISTVPARKIIDVVTKADLFLGLDGRFPCGDLMVSAATGAGLQKLRDEIVARIVSDRGSRDSVVITSLRQMNCLEDAARCLRQARLSVESGLELASADLALCVSALERFTGRIGVEDVLSEIFSRFCIGK